MAKPAQKLTNSGSDQPENNQQDILSDEVCVVDNDALGPNMVLASLSDDIVLDLIELEQAAKENGEDANVSENGEENVRFVQVQLGENDVDSVLPPMEELKSATDETQDAAKIEPAAGDEQNNSGEEVSAATAQQLSQIEPAAGNQGGGNPSGVRGYGFQSSFEAQGVIQIEDVGPIDPTQLQYGFDPRVDEQFLFDSANAPLPPLNPEIELGDHEVYEDGSVTLLSFVSPESANGELTITISGIPDGWTVSDEAFDSSDNPIGTGVFDSVTGTWTITLSPGETFDGGPIFTPPADSDVDALSLTFSADEVDATTGQSGTNGQSFNIIVDAVADAPEVDGLDNSGAEGATLAVDISGLTGEEVNNGAGSDDGSESITGYQISGVPAGFTLSAGTETSPGSGVFDLTPAELAGLTITPNNPDFSGSINLDVTVFTTENPTTDGEFDNTNDDAQDSDSFTLTWNPVADAPKLEVEDAQVKEDGDVFVPVTAELADTDGSEFLTITVDGIPTDWTFDGTGWTQTGPNTYEITVPAGSDYNDGFTLSPPADSDVDLTGITVTATSTESANSDSASVSETIDVIVDAVADEPDVDAQDDAGLEGATLDIDVSALTGEEVNNGAGSDDGSESITHYEISGVPAGFTLSAGTETSPGSGVYVLTPAEIVGLTITPNDSNFSGSITLTATAYTQDGPTDGEFDNADNTENASDDFTLTWKPVVNPPSVEVNQGVDDVLVKEDGTVDVQITSALGENPGANEFLTVVVEGIDPSWGFSAPIGTYDNVAGTWTVVLPAGDSLDTLLTFTPPADSDVDLTGLTATATATDPDVSLSATSGPDDFNVLVDAVADKPNLNAGSGAGEEGTTIPLTITTSVNDTDGSEVIEVIKIGNLPAGTTLTAGTYDPVDDVWLLDPADLAGLGINVPDGVVGNFELTVESVAYEQNTSGVEDDLTDNRASAYDTIKLAIEKDDTPEVEDDEITVDETNLDPTTSASGNIVADFGSDNPGSIEGNGTYFIGDLKSGGDPVTVEFDAGTNTYTGSAGGDDVFTLVIDNNGDYTFTLLGTVDHPDTTDHDDSLALEFGVKATDSDDDVENAVITVNIKDDGPYIENLFKTVDESNFGDGPLVRTETLDFDFGEDGAGSIKPTGMFKAKYENDGADEDIFSGGELVEVSIDGNGYIGQLPGGETVFTLEVDGLTGEYTYTQYLPLDHHIAGDPDEVIWLKFFVEICDADGDTDLAFIGIDVHDSAVNDFVGSKVEVDETALDPSDEASNVVTADFGGDGMGGFMPTDVSSISFTGATADALTSDGEPVEIEIVGNSYVGKLASGETIFTLDINPDGNYTFTLLGTLDHADTSDHDDVIEINFGVKATDFDGDSTASGEITVCIKDDGPYIENLFKTVDESNFGDGPLVRTETLDFDFGEDGAGSIKPTGMFKAKYENDGADEDIFSGGELVEVSIDGNGYIGQLPGGETVFTLEVDGLTGEYTYTQYLPLDHHIAGDPDEVIWLKFFVEICDADGDTDLAFIGIDVHDSAVNDFVGSKVEVDETALDPSDEASNVVTADFGGDGMGGFMPTDVSSISFTGATADALTSDGEPVEIEIVGNSYVGKLASGETIFTLDINPDGNYTFTLLGTLDHADTSDHDDVIEINFGVKATDFDGDSTASGEITVCIKDDGPYIENLFKTVDESNFGDGPLVRTETLDFDFGEDGAGSIKPTGMFKAKYENDGADEDIFSGGELVEVSIDGNGYIGQLPGGETVFTLEVDGLTGEYTYTQYLPLDHHIAGDPDEVIWLKFFVEICDADGDTDLAFIGIDVHDSGVIARDDCPEFNASEGTYDGNVIDNDQQSFDDPNVIKQVSFEGNVVDIPENGDNVTIEGDYGVLTINNTGAYSYDPFDNAFSQGYQYSIDNPPGSANGGDIKNITTCYDENTNQFSFEMKIDDVSEGFTLAINGGPNPKGHANEMALIYFDASGAEPVVTIYNYNGLNTQTSWQGSEIVSSIATADIFSNISVTTDGSGNKIFSFDMDATTIQEFSNDPDWTGVSFADQLGMWLHPVKGLDTDYDADGFLTQWSTNGTGWYDTSYRDTEHKDDLECVEDQFEYVLVDADGDYDDAVLKIKTYNDAGELIVGQNVNDDDTSDVAHLVNGDEGVITGSIGSDVLVGDAGGSTVEQQTQDYNFVFMLDYSGSMGSTGDANSKISLLKDAVNNLLNDVSSYDGGQIAVHLVPFNTQTLSTATYTITNPGELANLQAYLDGLSTGGFTNYEDPLQEAIDWLEGDGPFGGNAITTTYFVSDGAPNRYIDDSDAVASGSAAEVIDEITGGDFTNEVGLIQSLSDEVISVGISVGSNISRLDIIDSDGVTLEIDDPADLTAALADTSPLDKFLAAGDDVIEGGDAADIIFGDVLFTDDLADFHGLSTEDGSGWEVFERLENGESTVDAGWTRDDSIAYIRNNAEDLAEESVNSEGQGRDGGNDTISGGAGDDTIFGQEGDDIIAGGAGNDTLYGGSGNDIFLFEAITEGIDAIKDFVAGEDLLDLSAIITGYDETDVTQDITDFVIATEDLSGNTTIAVDQSGNAGAGGSTEIAVLDGVTGLDLDLAIKTDTIV